MPPHSEGTLNLVLKQMNYISRPILSKYTTNYKVLIKNAKPSRPIGYNVRHSTVFSSLKLAEFCFRNSLCTDQERKLISFFNKLMLFQTITFITSTLFYSLNKISYRFPIQKLLTLISLL